MWDLARPGIKPISLASAGRFFTTEPPGKPRFRKFETDFPIAAVLHWQFQSQTHLWNVIQFITKLSPNPVNWTESFQQNLIFTKSARVGFCLVINNLVWFKKKKQNTIRTWILENVSPFLPCPTPTHISYSHRNRKGSIFFSPWSWFLDQETSRKLTYI